ncbi:MAG: hypothetical protein H6907_06530 [Hyphomicrobiales bacterium]|nr:hypothetical protein [Hyphomicrobiales bacterium]
MSPIAIPTAARAALAAAVLLFAAAAAPDGPVRADPAPAAQPSRAEILKRIENLNRRAKACDPGSPCQARVRQALDQANRQLGDLDAGAGAGAAPPQVPPKASTGAAPKPAPPPAATLPTAQAMENAQKAQEAARRNLAGREDDPCYPVLLENETGRLFTGYATPWVVCTPVRFDLTWDMDDTRSRHSPFPTDAARYRLHETYPGHVKVVYDQDRRSLVRQLNVVGPTGAAAGRQATLESMAALYLAEFPPGPVRLPDVSGAHSADPNQVSRTVVTMMTAMLGGGGPRYATVQTGRTDAFQVDPGTSRFHFQASSDYGPQNRFLYQELTVNPARITAEDGRLVLPPGRLADHDVPFHEWATGALWDQGGKLMTVAEVMAALDRGVLEKTFPVRYRMDVAPLSMVIDSRGTLTLRISLGPPSDLVVTPDKGLAAAGSTLDAKITPAGRDYRLANRGKVPLRFSVKPDRPWVTARPDRGEIAAGQAVTVRIAFDAARAGKLKQGLHKATVAFRNTSSGRGDTSRPVTLDKAPEQRWRVALTGRRYVKHREVKPVKDPGAGRGQLLEYFHGIEFTYALTAEFTLRKRDKAWVYRTGTITAATVDVSYHQQPEIYAVDRTRCTTCGTVTRLKGTALGGLVQDNGSVILHWPNRTPAAQVHTRLRLQCTPGEGYDTCQRQRRDGATYSIADDDFLQRAGGHVLPLRDGPFHPAFKGRPTATGELLIDHRYVLKRLK